MKKTTTTACLGMAVFTSGADIVRFPERSFGKRDVSVADGHDEWSAPEPIRDPVLAETTGIVAQISGSTSLAFDPGGLLGGTGILSGST